MTWRAMFGRPWTEVLAELRRAVEAEGCECAPDGKEPFKLRCRAAPAHGSTAFTARPHIRPLFQLALEPFCPGPHFHYP